MQVHRLQPPAVRLPLILLPHFLLPRRRRQGPLFPFYATFVDFRSQHEGISSDTWKTRESKEIQVQRLLKGVSP